MSADRFTSVHRRARFRVTLLALLAVAVAAGALWGFWSWRTVSAPRLAGPADKTPLSEALAWPWADFPATTATERARIEREFKIKEPLLAARILPWTALPEAPALRPGSAEGRTALAGALEQVRALPDPELDGVADDPEALEQRIDGAIDALAIAGRGQSGSWLVAYDRGALFLRRGNARAAARELEVARKAVDRAIAVEPNGCARRPLYEASVYTRYALGHARLRIAVGEEDPAAARAARDAALRALSWTLVDLYNALDGCPRDYPGIASSLQLFEIPPANLPTGALASDLIAAYLASPGFHRAEEKPEPVVCEPLPRSGRDERSYRDRGFCRSLKRAAPPFDRLFRARFDLYYKGDARAWEEENLLWALSNAVDWTAENPTANLDDPHLLYNLGALLTQLGEFAPASRLLAQAQASSADLPTDDAKRLDRLAAAAAVLAGGSPRGGANAKREPSLPRRLFRTLYPPEREIELPGAVRPTEFKPVGDAFEPSAESAIDDWLFLQLWRALLRKGELDAFEREHDRALAQKGISKDFFTGWRQDAMSELGERALARAERLAPTEPGKARLIRRFVSDHAGFPNEIRHRARSGVVGEIAWLGRRVWPFAIYVPLALLALAAPLAALSLVRAHRLAFATAYPNEKARAERDARMAAARRGPARRTRPASDEEEVEDDDR